jgi:hypothetical protein
VTNVSVGYSPGTRENARHDDTIHCRHDSGRLFDASHRIEVTDADSNRQFKPGFDGTIQTIKIDDLEQR